MPMTYMKHSVVSTARFTRSKNALEKTAAQIQKGSFDEEKCKAMRPGLEQCLTKFIELKATLDECLPKEDEMWLVRGWKTMFQNRNTS